MAIEAYDKAVEQEIPRMKLVCAWHPKIFGTEKVMREAAPGREKEGVSHGICGECRAELAKRKAERGTA